MAWNNGLDGRIFSDLTRTRLRNVKMDTADRACITVIPGTLALSDLKEAKKGEGIEKGISPEEYMAIMTLLENSETRFAGKKSDISEITKSLEDAETTKKQLEEYFSQKDYKAHLAADISDAEKELSSVKKTKPSLWDRIKLGKEEYDQRMRDYNDNVRNAEKKLKMAKENIVSPRTIEAVDVLGGDIKSNVSQFM